MKPIRILHVSDLHLAEQSERHSVLDRYHSLQAAIEKTLLSDIKDAILSGRVTDIGAAFGDLLEQDSITELIDVVRSVDNRINQPKIVVKEYEQDTYRSTFRLKSWST